MSFYPEIDEGAYISKFFNENDSDDTLYERCNMLTHLLAIHGYDSYPRISRNTSRGELKNYIQLVGDSYNNQCRLRMIHDAINITAEIVSFIPKMILCACLKGYALLSGDKQESDHRAIFSD